MGNAQISHRSLCFVIGILFTALTFTFAASPAISQELPDLVVTSLSVNNDCLVVVTMKNQGPGSLSPTAYQTGSSPALQLFKDNQPFGAWSLAGLDPGRILQQPGGTITWTRPSSKIVGSVTVRAQIDVSNVVTEADEANNELTSQLTCNPALPDLAVTQITFSTDCRSQVQLTNLGDASLPDSIFSSGGAFVVRYVDGVGKGWIPLGVIDPGKSLKNPGGTVTWTDQPEHMGAAKVRFRINKAGQEKSTANNDKEVPVPQQCQVADSGNRPDLVVTDLSVDQQCLVKVTLKNNGTGQLPASAYQTGSSPDLQLLKNNQPFGSWTLPGIDPDRTLQQPGGTVTWTRPSEKIAGNVTVKAEIDTSNVVTESNDANNGKTAQLSCSPSLPDLAVTKIDFDNDCRSQVHLKNVGKESLPDNLYLAGGAYVVRYVDGVSKGWIRLQDIDPGKALKNPGGTKVWTDYPQFKATAKVKFIISKAGQETTTANNSMEAVLPSGCKQTAEPASKQKAEPAVQKQLLKKPLPLPSRRQP